VARLEERIDANRADQAPVQVMEVALPHGVDSADIIQFAKKAFNLNVIFVKIKSFGLNGAISNSTF
jgi:hypothetical protein